ncbi:D-alanine--D-alanine ligase [Candidatus Falkowbacteria bacterium CG11_big_fil_rev_8_21_14_0_20_39_10]|uniref:D-alanine--D-alanine ligase n=1 Tax=Candidatus Falkowbacteria bacterium CG11_big_fil_rev_8_21_14_0_20_39_10 TaxID=1974570 RepID=A0A2M6K8P4_9BACT|nr:MAG: D-alanine--D-alanine ligase [Candidatus Falkowbacteria bacterium CG11_big_fil_rev_8_21_14_0_20_39_10]
MAKLKIALLAGGVSGEREVSLKTGEKIYQALDKNKYEISRYDPKTDLKQFFSDAVDKKFDLVFPALHGPFGEDGKLQGMLDMIGMPYVFSGCLASALGMNKYKTKVLARDKGVESAEDLILVKGKNYDTNILISELGLPIVIKPIELGSSVGMSIAKTKEELEKGIKLAFKHDEEVLLEQFIKGRELTVAVMGAKYNPEALPVIEIIPKASEWFDYKAKYEPGASEEVCPAQIPDKVRDKAQDLAKKVYSAVGCKDLARVDFIWSKDDDKLYLLEINTIPGMTATSLAPQAAKAAGLEFPEFLDRLIEGNVKK